MISAVTQTPSTRQPPSRNASPFPQTVSELACLSVWLWLCFLCPSVCLSVSVCLSLYFSLFKGEGRRQLRTVEKGMCSPNWVWLDGWIDKIICMCRCSPIWSAPCRVCSSNLEGLLPRWEDVWREEGRETKEKESWQRCFCSALNLLLVCSVEADLFLTPPPQTLVSKLFGSEWVGGWYIGSSFFFFPPFFFFFFFGVVVVVVVRKYVCSYAYYSLLRV